MAAPMHLRALVTFACEVKGVEYTVHAGDVVRAIHPAVKGPEELFEPETPMEQATAARGENEHVRAWRIPQRAAGPPGPNASPAAPRLWALR
jgi:hypothetical protein